jgi:hypothetical protein
MKAFLFKKNTDIILTLPDPYTSLLEEMTSSGLWDNTSTDYKLIK